MVEELFEYIFGIYIKFGYKNPSTLTPYNSVDFATSDYAVLSLDKVASAPES